MCACVCFYLAGSGLGGLLHHGVDDLLRCGHVELAHDALEIFRVQLLLLVRVQIERCLELLNFLLLERVLKGPGRSASPTHKQTKKKVTGVLGTKP